MTNFIKEACVEFLEEALKAKEFGADRVELYADLSQDAISVRIVSVIPVG